MLAELLGGAGATEVADLLDPDVVLALDAELARRTEERRIRDAEGLADLLRALGPLSAQQIAAACGGDAVWERWARQLVEARRVIVVRIGGRERWAGVEDAAALRDGLGVALPSGLPAEFTEPAADPLGGLVRRHARTRGPFTAAAMAAELGLGVVVAERELGRLAAAGKLATGRLRPAEAGGGGGADYCDTEILGRLRRRSLARLRRQVEPVEQRVLGAFAPRWHQFGRLRGADGVLQAVAQLGGAALPASAVESLILPARVSDYSPALLDQLVTAGEVTWVGQGRASGADGVIRLFASGTDDPVLASVEPVPGELGRALLEALGQGGAYLAGELAARSEAAGAGAGGAGLADALWELAWAGWATADSFAPVRAWLSGGRTAHKAQRQRQTRPVLGRRVLTAGAMGAGPGRLAPGALGAPADARVSGRWSLAPTPAAQGLAVTEEQSRAARASALIERHGILTRGAAASESSFAALYPVLSALEETGALRRGYFIEHLGGSQFALPPCPDLLRASAGTDETVLLAASDPANPYGAALAWPAHSGAHRPGRGAGAIVVLVGGDLVLYVERGGHTALSFGAGEELGRACDAIVGGVRAGRIASLKLTRLDGTDALAAHGALQPLAEALITAGFAVTPGGLRLRGNYARG
jgi:ATP-dependent Lhr-like helicase